MSEERAAEIRQALKQLGGDFNLIATQLQTLSEDMRDCGELPSEELIEDLRVMRENFQVLKQAIGELILIPNEPTSLFQLTKYLETVYPNPEESNLRESLLRTLSAVVNVSSEHHPELAEETRQAIQEALDYVQSVDEEQIQQQAQPLQELLDACSALYHLISQASELDDETCESLRNLVSNKFGSTLATAALRGRLSLEALVIQEEQASTLEMEDPLPEPEGEIIQLDVPQEVYPEALDTRFKEVYKEVEDVFLAHPVHEIIMGVLTRSKLGILDFGLITHRQTDKVAQLLQLWFALERDFNIKPSEVVTVLDFFGIKIENPKLVSTDPPLIFSADCSEGMPSQEVTIPCFWSRPSEDEIFKHAPKFEDATSQVCLHFGTLTSDRRFNLSKMCQIDSRGLLIIDSVLLLYICANPAPSNDVLQEGWLPFESAKG